LNKTKIMAFTLVLSLMLLGAGYAAWSETATINNSVGTGDLRVEFVDDCDHPRGGASQYVDFELTHGNKVTTVTMGKMYPGALSVYELHIENLGSIPALFNNVDVVFDASSSELLKDNLRVYGWVQHKRPGQSAPVAFVPVWSVPLRDLEGALQTAMSGFNLLPGDYICFDVPDDAAKQQLAEEIPAYDPDTDNCLFFYLPECVDDDLELQCAQFDIIIDFKQFNQ